MGENRDMARCDCGAFESCKRCLALAARDLGPYTLEDYARHIRISSPLDLKELKEDPHDDD